MKGEYAMLYTGNTLREALGKALGTRDQYGLKIDRFSRGLSPALARKYTTIRVQPGTDIESLRPQAISRATSYIQNADVSEGAREMGYMEIYFQETGEIRVYPTEEAGRPSGQGEYDFVFRASMEGGEVLVTAHSHPLIPETGGAYDRERVRRINASNNGPSPQDNQRLSRLAPMIIVGSERTPEDFGRPPYMPIHEHPNYRSPR